MASLRSIIRDGRFASDGSLTQRQAELDRDLARQAHEELSSHDTILVNTDRVAADLQERFRSETTGPRWNDFTLIPSPKPPFRNMWLEAYSHGERIGALVKRFDTPTTESREAFLQRAFPGLYTPPGTEPPDQFGMGRRLIAMRRAEPATIVITAFWFETEGSAMFVGKDVCWLNTEGDYQGGFGIPWPSPADEASKKRASGRLAALQLWVLTAMGRLNCRNVKLVPMKAGAPKIRAGKKPQPPFSVWHEIVVTDSPLARRARAEDPASAEKHAVRLHKVRGHFADYRKGAGLFGKYKVLVWVDEHQAGEAELGTVVSSYRLGSEKH
jgi:hypothetical protein